MSKESFNWKSLFVNDAQETSPKAPASIPSPSSDQTKFPQQSFDAAAAGGENNPFIAEILGVYDKGFESLNSEGFDFFELYKSVNAVGVSNPQSYQMAFAMGKSIRPELSKELLLEKAKYYIGEIEKVYAKYDAVGNGKRTDLTNAITKDKDNLTRNISDLESRIVQLQNELQIKKLELTKIDSNSSAQFTEIQLKIEANDLAKQKILNSINQVITGINQYI